MKILICTPTYAKITHGPAKMVNFLAEINQRYPTYDLRILTHQPTQGTPAICYTCSPQTTFPVPLGKLRQGFDFAAQLATIYASFPFEILIFMDAVHGLPAWRKWRKRVKIIGCINDYATADFFTTTRYSLYNLRTYFIDWGHFYLERFCVRTFTAIISNSDYTQRFLKQVYSKENDNIVRLYRAVDIKRLAAYQKQNTVINISTAIRIVFVKSNLAIGGFSTLLLALGQLPYLFEVQVIGAYNQRKAQEQYQKNIASNCTIRWTGALSQEAVFVELQHADLCCVPAWKEAFGVVNAEALAIGLPVVSSDAGGIPEVLHHGKNGWQSRKRDVESLAQAIQNCLENPQERQQKATSGRAYVAAHFTKEKMLQNFIHIIEQL